MTVMIISDVVALRDKALQNPQAIKEVHVRSLLPQ